jgi:catechol 2,3-dioxygenase-like lactoylglutathione lyase family enzyme
MAPDLGYNGGLTCALGVSDFERSAAWYQENLGFELLYKVDEMGWGEFKTPVDRVLLGLSQVEKVEVKGGPTLTFGVNDIDRARATLEKRKVRFDGATITIPDMVKLATFYDCDGHKLMLYQSLGDTPG